MKKNYTFKKYQKESRKTAQYKPIGHKIIYPTLGLVGEAGEVAEKIKKIFRNKDGVFDLEDIESIKNELGDVLWYLSQIATELDIDLEDVAKTNIEKLFARLEKGLISGYGENR